MNLLDKNWPRLLIVVALAIFSCEDAHDIGLGLDPEGVRVKVLYTELPLEASNIWIDSLRTSGDSRFLIGKNIDPIFGTIESASYHQLNFLNSAVSLESELFTYVIDTTILTLSVSKVHSDDITSSQSFKIHQLTDTIFNTSQYFSNFETPYRTDRVEGEFSLILNEGRIRDKDSLDYIFQFGMSPQMGIELFDIAIGETGNSVSPAGALRNEYKGIVIKPDPANTALIGFKPLDSTFLSINYHIMVADTVYIDSLEVRLSLGTTASFYNQIAIDRTGSTMTAINGSYEKFDTGDGNVYLQPASGIFPKLSLGALNDFFKQNPNIQINRLEFLAQTSENSIYNNNVANIRFLYVDELDGSKINTIGIATNILIETAVMTDNGYLAGIPEMLVANLDETSLQYEGYPTFFGQLVETGTLDVDHVIVMPTDMTTPDFSVFDKETGFKIKLYYTLPE